MNLRWLNRFFLCDERRSNTPHDDDDLGHTAPRWAGVLNEKLNRLLAGQSSIYQQIARNERADRERDEFIMSELSDAVDALEANTTALSGVEESAEASFTRLAAMIADLKNNSTDPATAARIKALSDIVAARATSLAAAVAATPQ